MASEYYVVYDKSQGRWELQIPEDIAAGPGARVLETFGTKKAAMRRGKELARNQNARLVENAKAGYTMDHYDYSR